MNSKRYRIQDVEPGMVLAEPAVAMNGRIVLSYGTVLNEKLIDRLQQWNIFAVDIIDKPNETIDPKGAPTLLPVITPEQQTFNATYLEALTEVKETFERIRYYKNIPLSHIQNLAGGRLQELAEIPGAIHHLRTLEMMDERILQHSINVAVLAGVLGRWLGVSVRQISELILTGLLHDVGKMLIDADVAVKRPEDLTTAEAKVYRSHCVAGYRLLNGNGHNLPFNVLAGVLQHHEWIDGSGYPLGLRGDKIHFFAKVIAIADLYEIMTSDGLKNHQITPWMAVEIIIGQMFKKLDIEVATIFLSQLREQLVGNAVRLNDGREGLVVYLGTDIFQRPVVRTRDGGFVDLEKDRRINISAML